jgi:hypothetical protein
MVIFHPFIVDLPVENPFIVDLSLENGDFP